jgi:hypothetical protein
MGERARGKGRGKCEGKGNNDGTSPTASHTSDGVGVEGGGGTLHLQIETGTLVEF